MDDIRMPAEKPREIHPAGTFAAVCVDVIDLGMRVKEFQGHKKAAQTLALVFRTGKQNSDGFEFELAQEFTVSLFERAGLRKFLEAWRGAPFKPEEMGSSFSVTAIAKLPALISVVHKPSKDGSKVYANIGAIMPVPEGMPAPTRAPGYERARYWAERKERYEAEYRLFMRHGDEEPELGSEEPVPF